MPSPLLSLPGSDPLHAIELSSDDEDAPSPQGYRPQSPPVATAPGGLAYTPSILRLSPNTDLLHQRKAIGVTAEDFETLRSFMEDTVEATPNPRNPRHNLKRKQCTFVLPGIRGYVFGQYNQTFTGAPETWPAIARRVLEIVHARAEHPHLYTGVHVNLYRDGGVGVAPHADKEQSMLRGMPIYPFTLLRDPSTPRPFSIYTLDGAKLRDIPLGHGDLLVMRGAMQTEFKHGVEQLRPHKAYAPRINLTVRAFRPES